MMLARGSKGIGAAPPSGGGPDNGGTAAVDRSMRAYQWLGMAVIVGLFVVLGGWASLAAISSAVIVPGTVAVAGHPKKVQHLEGGIVSEILVKNADIVAAGDPLLRLDPTETNVNLQIVQGQIAELNALRARLKAELQRAAELPMPGKIATDATIDVREIWQDQAKLLKSRREARLGKEQQLAERIQQMEQVVVGLDAQRVSLDQQLALIKDELDGLLILDRQNLVPKSKLAAVQREAARLDGQRGQHLSEIARTKVQITETRLQIVEYQQQTETEIVQELRDTEAKLAEVREKETAMASRVKRLTLLAPIGGIVHKLNVHTVGGVVPPGETMLEIVPQEEALVLDGRLDPSFVDQVTPGQSVGIRLVALDQKETPEIDGEVVSIAPDVRQDNPQTPPYYAMRVKIDDISLADVTGRLVPGMPVELLVRGTNRTVLTYLVKPLTDRIAHTFRED